MSEASTRAKSPKKPADRKSKAALLDSDAVVIYEGVEFNVNFDAMDDDELFDGIDENPAVQSNLVRAVLGEDGQKKLRDLVRGEDGRARRTDVAEAFGKLMEDASAKNS